jgi:integrase
MPALRPKTTHQYGLIIRKHIIPNIGKVQLKDLRLARIEQFYSELISSGVGIRTVRVTHNVLHKALEKAVRYGLITYNPSHGATLPRYKHCEMQVLDENQVSQFLIAAQSSNYLALYYLAVTTGMRQGELFGLRWSDMHWNSGVLHIQRQLQKIPGQGWSFAEPKTKSARRSIILGERTLHVLRQHKERQAMLKINAGKLWQENDLVFPSKIGTPGDPSNLRVDFLKVLNCAGLPRIRFHDLRHTAASLLLNHGIPVIVVSNMLGHSKPSITLDVYGHVYHERQNEAGRVMDQLVAPILVELPQKAEHATTH